MVHPFLLSTMQGRKMFPSLPKTSQLIRLPCWAKNFKAKFLERKSSFSPSAGGLAGWCKVTVTQHLCHCTISKCTAVNCLMQPEQHTVPVQYLPQVMVSILGIKSLYTYIYIPEKNIVLQPGLSRTPCITQSVCCV